jgi:Toastrack DUF4097
MFHYLKSLALLCVSLVLTWGVAFGATSLERSFDFPEGGSLVVDSDIGSLRVQGTEGSTLRVAVEANCDLEENFELSFDPDKDLLVIHCRWKELEDSISLWDAIKGGFSDRKYNLQRPKVRFTIMVPRKINLDLTTNRDWIELNSIEGKVKAATSRQRIQAEGITGEVTLRNSRGAIILKEIEGPVEAATSRQRIQAEGITGKVTLHNSRGAIILKEIEGPVEATTTRQNIQAEEITGEVTLRNSRGAIILKEIEGPVEAATTRQNIKAEGITGKVTLHNSRGSITTVLNTIPSDDSELRTDRGKISLALPSETNALINARTNRGKVKTSLPLTVSGEFSKDKIEGVLGTGGPRIRLSNSRGDIVIAAAD